MPTRILLTSIVVNAALTVLKVAGGALTGSAGLVADGFHSLADVISMTVNYFGVTEISGESGALYGVPTIAGDALTFTTPGFVSESFTRSMIVSKPCASSARASR